jgi:adenosylmethionine-8-amino-7-oxononanoate aminotransferase
LLRPLGNVVYILPPYVISPEELHRVYDVIEEAIKTLL